MTHESGHVGSHTLPDMFSERASVSIAVIQATGASSSNDIRFESVINSINVAPGSKGTDFVTNIAGGRLVKFTPQEPVEITFEAYPVEAGTSLVAGATGFPARTAGCGFWDLMHGAALQYWGLANLADQKKADEAVVVSFDHARIPVRITILFSSDQPLPAAHVAQDINSACMRFVAANAYITEASQSFTDGELKWTVTARVAPFDKYGNSNFKAESWIHPDGGSTISGGIGTPLGLLATYTYAVKW